MATAVALHKDDIETNIERTESYHTPVAKLYSKEMFTTPGLFPSFSPAFNRTRSDTDISCETASSSLYEYSNQYGLARLGHLILKVLPIKASFLMETANSKANVAKDTVLEYMGEKFATLSLLLPPCLGRSFVSKLPPVISDKIKVNIRNKKKKGDSYNNKKDIETANDELWKSYTETGIETDDDNNEVNNDNDVDQSTPWIQSVGQIIGEMMNSKSLSLSESESAIVQELGIGNSHLASSSKDACLIESDEDDIVRSKIDDSFQTLRNGRLWPDSHRPTPIKKLPNGITHSY